MALSQQCINLSLRAAWLLIGQLLLLLNVGGGSYFSAGWHSTATGIGDSEQVLIINQTLNLYSEHQQQCELLGQPAGITAANRGAHAMHDAAVAALDAFKTPGLLACCL
jgi:hypothetical protein